MLTADFDNSLQQTLFSVGHNGFDLMLGKIFVLYYFLKFLHFLLKIVLSHQKCGFCLISAQVSEQFCLLCILTVMKNAVFGCSSSNVDSFFDYLSIILFERRNMTKKMFSSKHILRNMKTYFHQSFPIHPLFFCVFME